MERLIFGCGYVGLRVGNAWARRGDSVFGLTRKSGRFDELGSKGIRPLLGDVTDPGSLGDLPCCDTVLVAIGMDRSTYSDIREIYVDGLKNVLDALPSQTGHLIYISSTGVYGDFGGEWVDEQSATKPQREGGQACLDAERLIQNSCFSDRYTILRFAGIYGESRVPMKSAIGEWQSSRLKPDGYLNLIHVEDGVGVVEQVARQKPMGQIFLVSDGDPPQRKDYYDEIADILGTGPIDWTIVETSMAPRVRSDKRVCNSKLREQLGYVFRYPDFRAGLREALGQRT